VQEKAVNNHSERAKRRAENAIWNRKELKKKTNYDIHQSNIPLFIIPNILHSF